MNLDNLKDIIGTNVGRELSECVDRNIENTNKFNRWRMRIRLEEIVWNNVRGVVYMHTRSYFYSNEQILQQCEAAWNNLWM